MCVDCLCMNSLPLSVFIFRFVAFNPTQSLTTLEDSVNGAISLAVLYLTFMITSLLFAVPIVQRCGPRVGLIGSSWTYLFFVAARALPANLTSLRLYAMYATAFGVGAGGAVLWTCIGRFMLACALFFQQRDSQRVQARSSPRSVQAMRHAPSLAATTSTAYSLSMALSLTQLFSLARALNSHPTECTCSFARCACSDVCFTRLCPKTSSLSSLKKR